VAVGARRRGRAACGSVGDPGLRARDRPPVARDLQGGGDHRPRPQRPHSHRAPTPALPPGCCAASARR
jgi:hypothetical protein